MARLRISVARERINSSAGLENAKSQVCLFDTLFSRCKLLA
jgi:hypothetical protein